MLTTFVLMSVLSQSAAPVATSPWTGLAGVGLIVFTGNAESVTFSANAQADKKLESWSLGLKASGAYGQTTPSDGSATQTTALRAGVAGRVDRSVFTLATLFLGVGADTDHVKSLEGRLSAELGVGFKLWERKEGELERGLLRADLGARYAWESRYQYFATTQVPTVGALPSAQFLAPRLGILFQYALNKNIRFVEDAEALPNVLASDTGRFLVNSSTKVAAKMTDSVSLTVGFLINHDSKPAGGKKPTDASLTAGVESTF